VTATATSAAVAERRAEPAINFLITPAALLPQELHLVATLMCCDLIRHSRSWPTGRRGDSQQLGTRRSMTGARIKLFDLALLW
jgi:hypothetical protein